MNIKDISKPVAEHLNEFNKYFKEILKSENSLLNIILNYIANRKGKQVRPMLVFLSAELCGGVTERTYPGAAMAELLHIATLIHDDVVDNAIERRGMPSINAIWKNKISVLIGDYLLARGLLTALNNNEFGFLKITSNAVKRMSEGELLQIQKSKTIDIDEPTYFNIIADKTASLISACCEIGALSANVDERQQIALRNYGEFLGIAYQIRDDIFDYRSKSSVIGKPIGNDLKEKKLTLPLIYSFTKVKKTEAKEIVKLIKSGNLKSKDIKFIANFVIENGGIDYAEQKAEEYTKKALREIEFFDESPAKQSLIELTRFVIQRES